MEKLKEVYFDEYCKRCVYKERSEDDDPCFCCLANPVNVDSHKPTEFKENEDA